jgi:amino acid transporter
MTQPNTSAGETTLTRGFSFWSSFSLAFAIVSPIIAVYSVLGFALQEGGPGAWWTFPFVMLGALAIGGVLAHLASRWPFEGSIYQWCRRLGGPTFGWWAGWTYLCTYAIASAAICYGVVAFLPPVLGMKSFSLGVQLVVAVVVLLLATLANTTARRWLKILVAASIVAEVIGSVGVGTMLLLFHRHQPASVLVNFDGKGVLGGFGISGMLGALAFVGWAYNGFESAASIGEEVRNPRRAIPRAIILVIVSIAVVAMYSSAAIILALPDIKAAISGSEEDPVVSTIVLALGETWARPLFVLFMISFFAGLVAAETAVSRVIWAYARDNVLPGSRSLVALSGEDRLPVRATLATAGVVGILLLVGLQHNVFGTLVTFTTGGFFIVFSLAIGGYLYRKSKGQWVDGPFTLGRWSVPVAVVAIVWSVLEFVNIAWPRGGLPWYESWGVILMIGVAAVVGAVVYLPVRATVRSGWSHDDADDDASDAEPTGPGLRTGQSGEPSPAV